MRRKIIFLYPGHITKGLNGRILWHPRLPEFDLKQNDWPSTGSVEITSCIHDPWPFGEGGKEFIMEVETQ
jgi:hypothetical protein